MPLLAPPSESNLCCCLLPCTSGKLHEGSFLGGFHTETPTGQPTPPPSFSPLETAWEVLREAVTAHRIPPGQGHPSDWLCGKSGQTLLQTCIGLAACAYFPLSNPSQSPNTEVLPQHLHVWVNPWPPSAQCLRSPRKIPLQTQVCLQALCHAAHTCVLSPPRQAPRWRDPFSPFHWCDLACSEPQHVWLPSLHPRSLQPAASASLASFSHASPPASPRCFSPCKSTPPLSSHRRSKQCHFPSPRPWGNLGESAKSNLDKAKSLNETRQLGQALYGWVWDQRQRDRNLGQIQPDLIRSDQIQWDPSRSG